MFKKLFGKKSLKVGIPPYTENKFSGKILTNSDIHFIIESLKHYIMKKVYTTEELSNAWWIVHSSLGMTIYWDIQGLKVRLKNKDAIKRKMVSMSKTLIERVKKDPKIDPFSEGFMDHYNSDPSLYMGLIIEEYTNEYENTFHILYDFHIELENHKSNMERILKKIKGKKGKTEEEHKYIDFLNEYIITIKDKFSQGLLEKSEQVV